MDTPTNIQEKQNKKLNRAGNRNKETKGAAPGQRRKTRKTVTKHQERNTLQAPAEKANAPLQGGNNKKWLRLPIIKGARGNFREKKGNKKPFSNIAPSVNPITFSKSPATKAREDLLCEAPEYQRELSRTWSEPPLELPHPP